MRRQSWRRTRRLRKQAAAVAEEAAAVAEEAAAVFEEDAAGRGGGMAFLDEVALTSSKSRQLCSG